MRVVLSHPCDKDKCVARMGHPAHSLAPSTFRGRTAYPPPLLSFICSLGLPSKPCWERRPFPGRSSKDVQNRVENPAAQLGCGHIPRRRVNAHGRLGRPRRHRSRRRLRNSQTSRRDNDARLRRIHGHHRPHLRFHEWHRCLGGSSASQVPGKNDNRQQDGAHGPTQRPGNAQPQSIIKHPDAGKDLCSPHGQLSRLLSPESLEEQSKTERDSQDDEENAPGIWHSFRLGFGAGREH